MFEHVRRLSGFPEGSKRPDGVPLALQDVKIVDFTHYIAGPFATMILADLGADVVKIEAPGKGDDFRKYPPIQDEIAAGPPFLWCNRNKRSITLDLKSEAGLATVRALVAKADVVVENFSTGVMERLGLGYAALQQINPALIFCSVSAYGRSGSYKDRLGFDPIAQAESGFMSMNGYPDRDGVRALGPVMDISTAMMASNAVLAALFARARTGKGQAVEVALYDTSFLMTGYAAFQEMFTGTVAPRFGNVSPDTCPSGCFHAADGAFYINSGNDRIFRRLMLDVLGLPEMAADPRFQTNKDRIDTRAEIFTRIQAVFETQPRAYWSQKMREAGVPCGEVRTVYEAVAAPEAIEREVFTRVEHPELGWVPNIRNPIRMAETPLADIRPAPRAGQDTASVLADWLGETPAAR
jgi:crotonobetainyl-CoA:carnitine CoA-transferase CaiB-like acyl-CoA transferase